MSMQNKKYNFTVDALKTRLDKYLAEQLPAISRAHIQKDIEAGKVLVNGKLVVVTKHIVRVDDKVEYDYVEPPLTKTFPASISF